MVIITTTDNKKLSNKEIFESVEFFMSLLLSESKRDNLTINISFDARDAVPGWQAACIPTSRKEYDIWIRKSAPPRDQLVNLAHELVHVKQFVLKELCPLTLTVKSAILKKMSIQSTDDYWDNPAEIEAFGRAEGLVTRYLQQSKEK
jgi:hypothetical protein